MQLWLWLWIQTPTFNEIGTLALQTSNEKCNIFRDAKATGLGSEAFCLCPFFFSYHTNHQKQEQEKWNMEDLITHDQLWRVAANLILVSLQITLFVWFCFLYFCFVLFFAVVLNIKQLKLELGWNEKPSLMVNFSFAHMRAREGGFMRLFLAIHSVELPQELEQTSAKRDDYLCHDQRNKSHIWANGACEKTVILVYDPRKRSTVTAILSQNFNAGEGGLPLKQINHHMHERKFQWENIFKALFEKKTTTVFSVHA